MGNQPANQGVVLGDCNSKETGAWSCATHEPALIGASHEYGNTLNYRASHSSFGRRRPIRPRALVLSDARPVTSASNPPPARAVAGIDAPDSTPRAKAKASNTTSQLPPHIEETVRAISRLHTEHHQRATFSDHLVDRATSLFGRPAFIVVLSLAVVLWVGGNFVLSHTLHVAFDVPPFPWLQNGLTLMALYMGALILTTQRRADHLGELREQMTLELAILTEQKAAKLIGLIEELRRD